eukprot:gene14761-20812_t
MCLTGRSQGQARAGASHQLVTGTPAPGAHDRQFCECVCTAVRVQQYKQLSASLAFSPDSTLYGVAWIDKNPAATMVVGEGPNDIASIKKHMNDAQVAARLKVCSKALQSYEESIRACVAIQGGAEVQQLKAQAQQGVGKVYYMQGEYGHALEACLQAVETVGEGAASALLHALIAKSALLNGSYTTALKHANRALALKPQDSDTRAVISASNIELEYAAAVNALDDAASTRGGTQVMVLLQTLAPKEGSKGIVESLLKLSRVTSSSLEAQVVFQQNSGFQIVMSHFNEAYYNAVASVLVAAGLCKVASVFSGVDSVGSTSELKKKHKKITDAASMASALTAAAADNAEGRSGLLTGASGGLDSWLRLRWPQMVLEQLASVAISDTSSPAMAECEFSGSITFL